MSTATIHPSTADGEVAALIDRTLARAREHARIEYEATADLCADVTAEQLGTMAEWLERGAASGDPGAGLCYAMLGGSEDLAPSPRYGDAWVDWMQRYRSRASALAEAAFMAGYPQAAWYLYDATAGPYTMPAFRMDRTVAPDLPKALAYAWFEIEYFEAQSDAAFELMIRDFRVRAAAIEKELDAAQIDEARQRARAQAERMRSMPAPSPPCAGLDML